MMKPHSLLLALGISVEGALLISLPSSAAIQFPESCRMGSCRTTTLESKEALRSNEFGTLYVINTTANMYPHNSGDEFTARNYQEFVNFYKTDYVTEQGQSYVFCSKTIPSVLFESEGNYIVARLALFQSPSTARRSDHQDYLATCHNLAGPDYFSLAVQTLLIREGYTTQYVSEDDQFNVSSILEIMELYPDRY